jgi:signal transduction histidine kinase
MSAADDPRRRHRVRWRTLAFALALAVIGAASVLQGFPGPQAGEPTEHAAPLRHTQAELAVVALGPQALELGQHLPESALLSIPRQALPLPPADRQAWQPVTLPDHATRDAVLRSGEPYAVELRWYRLVLPARPDEPEPRALHLPRVIGGPVLVLARAQGGAGWRVLLDNRSHWLSQWNRPVYAALPPELSAAPAGVELAIGLPTIHGVQFGLSAPIIGPASAVASPQATRTFWQVDMMRTISLCGLLLGALALALAWRRQQPALNLLFAAITVVWATRNLHYFVAPPIERSAYEWFWWVTNSSISWLTVLFYLFTLRFLPRRYPGLERGLIAFCTLLSLLTLPVWPLRGEVLVLQHLLNILVAAGVCLFLIGHALRGAGPDFAVLAGTLVVGIALAAHDLLLLAGRLPPERYYLLPYCCLLLLFNFQQVLARRHAKAFDQLSLANREQERRLLEQEAELNVHHQRIRSFERERVLADERQRLMRDMHDGLGSSLLTALAVSHQGQLGQQDLSRILGECVDDLRMVIDSLEPIEHDLATLLGTLRLRLGHRLEASGLTLHWEVDDVPALPWLDPPSALQILRIVQELLTNVLKHSRARHVHVSLRSGGGGVEVSVSDDGVGPAGLVAGRGIRNMHQRAAALGAELSLATRPQGGTQATVRFAVQRKGAG